MRSVMAITGMGMGIDMDLPDDPGRLEPPAEQGTVSV
jgi:hypothetical protein